MPELRLQKVIYKDHGRPQTSGKSSLNEILSYRSDRNYRDIVGETKVKYSSPEADRKKNGQAKEMNIYLYKNFNKLIHNFYLKTEEAQKTKKMETRIKDKYMNHPYQQELNSAKTKKLLIETKKGNIYAPPITKMTQSKSPSSVRVNLSPIERIPVEEEFKIHEKKRPKTGEKRSFGEEKFMSKEMQLMQTILKGSKLKKSPTQKELNTIKGGYIEKK